MWKNTRNVFYKTRAARNTNSCRKEISIVASVLWQQHKIYVFILRSKCGKTPEMFSIKRVRFVIFVRKGISIIASALAATDKIYVYILRSKCGKIPEMFSINKTRAARNTTGSPSSLGTVNMTLRDSVIIRVCVGNISIVRNSSK